MVKNDRYDLGVGTFGDHPFFKFEEGGNPSGFCATVSTEEDVLGCFFLGAEGTFVVVLEAPFLHFFSIAEVTRGVLDKAPSLVEAEAIDCVAAGVPIN